jgi:hypothetical protein
MTSLIKYVMLELTYIVLSHASLTRLIKLIVLELTHIILYIYASTRPKHELLSFCIMNMLLY